MLAGGDVMYNLNHLWTFMKVAELGSFHKVAREAYMSPNAVMKHINSLEEELGGIKLFNRTKSGNELTEAGRLLYDDATFILDYCNQSKKNILNNASESRNNVRIWVSYASPIHVFQDLWDNLRKRYPDIDISIVSGDNHYDTIKKLWYSFGKDVDVAFIVSDSLNQVTDNFVELDKLPVSALLSRNHRLAYKEIITADDLASERIIALNDESINCISSFCSYLEAGFPDIDIEYKEYYDTETFNVCANSNKIMLNVHDIVPVHPYLKSIPIDWKIKSSFGLVFAENPKGSVIKFIEAVKEILGEE